MAWADDTRLKPVQCTLSHAALQGGATDSIQTTVWGYDGWNPASDPLPTRDTRRGCEEPTVPWGNETRKTWKMRNCGSPIVKNQDHDDKIHCQMGQIDNMNGKGTSTEGGTHRRRWTTRTRGSIKQHDAGSHELILQHRRVTWMLSSGLRCFGWGTCRSRLAVRLFKRFSRKIITLPKNTSLAKVTIPPKNISVKYENELWWKKRENKLLVLSFLKSWWFEKLKLQWTLELPSKQFSKLGFFLNFERVSFGEGSFGKLWFWEITQGHDQK